MGHEVVHLSSEDVPDVQHYGKFDLYLWVDWGEDALTGILPYKPISMVDLHPSVYITSDTHLGYDYRLKKAREFDYVFCNQLRAVEEFKRDGVNAKWLPHAVEPQAYPNYPPCIKKYDVGFVGFVTFRKRAEVLDKVLRAFPDFWYGQRLFEEAAEIYRQSKLVLNPSALDDVNMRCFEATATGSAMLVEWTPTLHDLFSEDEVVAYKTTDEAIELCQFYIENSKEREELARRGMNRCLSNHTYTHRATEVLKEVGL
jgi:hypothetical protein